MTLADFIKKRAAWIAELQRHERALNDPALTSTEHAEAHVTLRKAQDEYDAWLALHQTDAFAALDGASE